MDRLHQAILIFSTILASWLGMQAVHESGHILGAWASGGHVTKVVLHPLTISRTESTSDHPLFVVWAGPVIGVLLPVGIWQIAARLRITGSFLLRFFAGFCLIANGLYIGIGSFDGIGDCGVMLQHGSPKWILWLFGAVTVPVGFLLWHRQGEHFGFGPAKGRVDRGVAWSALVFCLMILTIAFVVDGE